jgi:phosphate butyryltransferase
MQIDSNISKIMKEKGIDVETLSKITKINLETLDDIVGGKTQPLASDLLKIANALSVDMAKLLYDKAFEEKKAHKTSAKDRIRVKRRDNFRYESLAPYYSGKHIEPFALEIYKTDKPDFSMHEGEEFHYVLDGRIKIVVDKEQFILEKGDSMYFDSSLPHSVESLVDVSKVIAAIYNPGSMIHSTKSKKMRDLIQTAKFLSKQSLVLVSPDNTSLGAVNKAIEEDIIDKAYLVGSKENIESMCNETLIHNKRYVFEYINNDRDSYELMCAKRGVEIVKSKLAKMIMKGKINTANFVRAVLDKDEGISTKRRLSLVSIFELPNLNRLIFLTDAGINPELFPGDDLQASLDIINNAIDVAKSLGVARPKVALLDANEMPSSKIPTTVYEKEIAQMNWEDADVYGPLSYDLALYEDAVKKKGLDSNPVAGKADILVVPHIEGGNFLYKAWVMTMGAEVANIVLGAKAPIILTSRSDSDITKFLTICSSAIYSKYIES